MAPDGEAIFAAPFAAEMEMCATDETKAGASADAPVRFPDYESRLFLL